MRVAVIGSRGYDNYEEMKSILDRLDITLIVSGGANGADSLGERYAKECDIPTQLFLPDWKGLGKRAGFHRNSTIVYNSDMIVAFWDQTSKGTAHSISEAEKMGKKVLVVKFNKQ